MQRRKATSRDAQADPERDADGASPIRRPTAWCSTVLCDQNVPDLLCATVPKRFPKTECERLSSSHVLGTLFPLPILSIPVCLSLPFLAGSPRSGSRGVCRVTSQVPSPQKPQMPPQRFTEHLRPKLCAEHASGGEGGREGERGGGRWILPCKESGFLGSLGECWRGLAEGAFGDVLEGCRWKCH